MDYMNNIIARAYDESHLNKYRADNKQEFSILHPCYALPGDYPAEEFPFSAKIIHSPSYKNEILGR
jgi:hypothetical protein